MKELRHLQASEGRVLNVISRTFHKRSANINTRVGFLENLMNVLGYLFWKLLSSPYFFSSSTSKGTSLILETSVIINRHPNTMQRSANFSPLCSVTLIQYGQAQKISTHSSMRICFFAPLLSKVMHFLIQWSVMIKLQLSRVHPFSQHNISSKVRTQCVLPKGKNSDINFNFIQYFQSFAPKNTLCHNIITTSYHFTPLLLANLKWFKFVSLHFYLFH